MPHKDFQIWLTDKVYLVIDYETDVGRVVGFVVRLMLRDMTPHMKRPIGTSSRDQIK
jgi:hypothetical protein